MDWRTVIGVGLTVWLGVNLAACRVEGESSTRSTQTEPTPLFMLSADGVGPLNASTPFNLVRIGDAFQDFNVAQETYFQSGAQYPVITVKQQVKPLLSINPDYQQQKIFSVVVHDNLVGNKLGHKIGAKFNEVYSYGKTEQCAPGMEEWAGKVMCLAPNTGNILYLFSGQWNGPDNEVPPLDVLANWQLEAMVWKAPKPQ